MKHTNRLANESSPYLLQHANNPVNWYPWNNEALAKAMEEDKPIILSIGYSSCHWCHVMERESFENEQIAQVMNEHFVCIKVDREERPDIDQIYMEALHAMGVNGGWPLNVFLTADEQPFYGGTYFPPQQWGSILIQIAKAYKEKRKELNESATLFTKVLQQSEHERYQMDQTLSLHKRSLKSMFQNLAKNLDSEKGGTKGAPKFPLPSIIEFLMRYYDLCFDKQALNHAVHTLRQMAYGGIYDQIGGGFSRYSVDAEWFAPHFEKMLYDNAQLISTYAEAYTLTGDLNFLQVVEESLNFASKEFLSGDGAFYSALDADSEGVEGKFYTWTYTELKELIPDDDFGYFQQYFGVTEVGNWEKGRNILYKTSDDDSFSEKHSLSFDEFDEKKALWKNLLLERRKTRVRPSLDDKVLSSWNGLMIKAFASAYMTTGRATYLAQAQQTARFIHEKMMKDEVLLHAYKNGKASIVGYLEDYAAVIQGYYTLYQAGFEKIWLHRAERLTEYVLKAFSDEENPLFFFTDKAASKLIARKKEVFDNVIPSSNSLMMSNLYHLGVILGRKEWVTKAQEMLNSVSGMMDKSIQDLTNWASIATMMIGRTAEVVIVGRKSPFMALELRQTYIPNKVVIASEKEDNTLELLKGRKAIKGKTTVYVCYDKSCQLPVHTPEDAVEIIRKME